MVRHNRININSNITFLITTIVILAVFTIWTWRQHQYPVVGIDDANIFFSYAENFASGNGITYACNEERVEGFTSMLWMLLCTVMFLLGVNEIGVFFLSFLILTITQILFLKVIYNSAYNVNGLPPIIYQSIYVVLILSSPAYLTWMTITLMDTSIWGFVIAGMTYALILPPHSRITTLLCIIIFAIAPLTRPEALLVAPVFLILLWLRGLSLGNSQTTRICLLIGLTMVLTIVFLTIFRVQYFGYPLPNTYYAKVSPSIHYNFRMGENYLYDFLSSGTIISLTVALIVCRCTWWFGHMLDRLLQEKSFRVLLDPQMSAGVSVSFGTLILLIVPVLTGGDHFRMFRFFQPAYPVICLIPILSALEWKVIKCNLLSFQWVRHNVIKTLLMSFVLSYWFFTYAHTPSWKSFKWGSEIEHEFRIAEGGIAYGHLINLLFSELETLPSIGVISSGGIARSYRGPIVDLMGLNNTMIAHYDGDRIGMKNHAAFEKRAFFGVAPNIVLAAPPVLPETDNFENALLKGLLEDLRFVESYRYGKVFIDDHQAEMHAFLHKELVEIIETTPGLHFIDTMIWSNKWIEAIVSLNNEATETAPNY